MGGPVGIRGMTPSSCQLQENDMIQMLVEAVVLSFTIGGIVGAVVALSLRGRRNVRVQERRLVEHEIPAAQPVPRRIRRR